jgi:hypothetical protein
MNSYRAFQIYTLLKVISYSLMLLSWVTNNSTWQQRVYIIINIAFYRFFEILFFSHLRNERTKKLKKIAAKMGLEFYKTDKNNILMPMLEKLPLFEERRPRTKSMLHDILVILETMVWLLLSTRSKVKVKNILINRKSNPIYAIFDFNRQEWQPYKYQDSSLSFDIKCVSLSIRNQSQTMILLASEDLHLPEFSVIAKEKTISQRFSTSICRLLGYQRKQGNSISQIFSSRINDFYKSEKNLCTTAQGDRLMCCRNNIIIEPKKIQSFLSTGFKAFELFKTTHNFSLKQDMDYTKLRDLLKAGNWKEADRETTIILLKARAKKVEDTNANIAVIFVDEIFLNPVLRAIDTLWIEYSQGHFGYSVQKRIWLEVGGKVEYNSECLLADKVGWCVNDKWLHYSDLNFSLNAPQGHLPTTELSLLPLGWFYLFKRPLFKIPGSIRYIRQQKLPACFIVSQF